MISYDLDSAIYRKQDRVANHSDFHREKTSIITLKMSNFVSIRKNFNLGSGRVLFALKNGSVYQIKIFEFGLDNRYVNFSIVRSASFVRAMD